MRTLSGKEFVKVLERKGWILKRINGSHHIYSHPDKTEIISVPVHKNEDFKKRTTEEFNEYCSSKG